MTNEEQRAMWNGPSGRAWVDGQALLDHILQPFEDVLIGALEPRDRRVLDVGCGNGSTTVAASKKVELAIGADISEPMIAVARSRGSNARFIVADAETHAFASVDLAMSRFGVMFFGDPVAAFANLRRAAQRLRFIVWRSPEENAFFTTAERAAGIELPPRPPDAPGQFSFADRSRVQRILQESGWTDIEIAPLDLECTMPESGLLTYSTRFGLVGRALDQADEETRASVAAKIRAAYEPYVHGAEARFPTACWLVNASAGTSAPAS